MARFVIEDLTFAYAGSERKVLDHVSTDLGPGKYVCVCGRSGSGKTTLLRHLKTILTPAGEQSGMVMLDGEPLKDISLRDQSAMIGFVMQNPDTQIVTDKVWHELSFGLESLGTDPDVMRLRVSEMASYFGIQHWFHKDVRDLSGSQKQLLNLASIMAMQPSVLILDEPTSQLDPIAASDFLNTVRKINVELGTTVIITEHRLEDVYATADQVIVLDRGRVLADGTPRDVSAILHDRGDPMTYALPAPVRIFYGVNLRDAKTPALSEMSGELASQYARAAHARIDQLAQSCPLTVREGRTWLTDRVLSHPTSRVALPDEPPCLQGQTDSFGNPLLDESAAAISLKDLWFRYDRESPDILRGLCMQIPRAQVSAIVGGNGTGKSTLLKCICGVLKPYRGSVSIFGRKLKDWNQYDLFNGCIAMMPQDPQNLFVKRTVREDLQEMLATLQLDAAERDRRLQTACEVCDLQELMDMHPLDLSGGELQRAALAKVLITEPRILLLDEPTKGIDSFFKRELASLFDRLRELGITVVMVSHDVEFCARFADSVSMFFDGDIVTTNTPRRFFSQNSFYTTAANRMSRNVFANAVTDEDVVELCLS